MSTNRSDYRTLPRRAALCAVVAVAAAVAMFSSRELPAQPAPAPGPGAARNAAPPPGAARNPTPAPAVTPPPASAPTSQPRYELAPPPGFVKMVVGDRMAVADKADEAWVREALTQLSPATRPSTMPSDLATNLNNKRADLVNTIAADFGVKDVAAIQRSIDAHVVPMLRQMQSFKAAIYYMPTTRQKLLAAVKGGWDNPQFHY